MLFERFVNKEIAYRLSISIFVFATGFAPNAEGSYIYEYDPSWPQSLEQFHWGQGKGINPDQKRSSDENAVGIAVDRNNSLVYVLVRTAPNVRVFREDGTFVRSWSPGNVGKVHMIHVDESGDVWIADDGEHTVMQYTPDGRVLLTLGTFGKPGMDGTHFDRPTDIATTPDLVFVSDGYTNNRIAKFDRSGMYLGMWGSREPGMKQGQFNVPHSVTAMGTKVYVADRTNGRVQIFDLNGNFLSELRDTLIPWAIANSENLVYTIGSSFDGAKHTTSEALSIAAASERVMAVMPPVGQVVVVLDADGNFVQKIRLPQGIELGQVEWAHGFDVGADGSLYVADVIGNHAQKWKKKRLID